MSVQDNEVPTDPSTVPAGPPAPLPGQTIEIIRGGPALEAPNRQFPPVDPLQGGAHPAYYSKIELSLNARPPRIDFVRAPGSPTPPPEYRALRRRIEEVARLVRILFQEDKTRLEEFFNQLHLTADSGLRGPDCSVEIGLDNLQDVKDGITDTFPEIRSSMWKWNFGILLTIIAVCCIAAGASYYVYPAIFSDMSKGPAFTATMGLAFFLIPLGVAFGLFVEFVFRVNDDIPYEKLQAINPGRWKPAQRAFNTVVVGYTFAAILALGAFQVGVANVLLNEFIDKKPYLSVAIGFVTGFTYPYVRDLIQQFRPARRDKTV